MISVKNAIDIIEQTSLKHDSKIISLDSALNKVLFQDVFSIINMPPFNQSAMDGYAIKHSLNKTYKLIGESAAGSTKDFQLKQGEAVRIFTGALVPKGANTVVMQEHIEIFNKNLTITKIPVKGANIRIAGEQIRQGELALKKGTLLNEAAIGFLACLGITKVSIFKSPKVSIVITGNELQPPGEVLEKGKVYESNAIMLSTALRNIGIDAITIFNTKDNYEATKATIKQALNTSDVVLISGGISVGDYDFVKQSLKDNQVEESFYKVNQKPGKPLWFGTKANTYVFGLPGNPASVLTCFYVYVLPLIRRMSGFQQNHLERIEVKSQSSFKNPSKKTLFLKAVIKDDGATILSGQSSAMLRSYSTSNGLLYVDENTTEIHVDDNVECIKLPNVWR